MTRRPSGHNFHVNQHSNIWLSSEISLAQSGAASLPSSCETQMVDVYREKPIRLVVKVTVPVKEHPKVSEETHELCQLEQIMSGKQTGHQLFVFTKIS